MKKLVWDPRILTSSHPSSLPLSSILWILPALAFTSALPVSALASSIWTIFHFQVLEYLQQGEWPYWFQYSHCHSQRERWRGLRHKEVKCVAKDRPPILIHPPSEAIWVSAGFEVFPSSSCACKLTGGSGPTWGALLNIIKHHVGADFILPSTSTREKLKYRVDCSTWYFRW